MIGLLILGKALLSAGIGKFLTVVLCLLFIGTYQRVVAAVMGWEYMSPMD